MIGHAVIDRQGNFGSGLVFKDRLSRGPTKVQRVGDVNGDVANVGRDSMFPLLKALFEWVVGFHLLTKYHLGQIRSKGFRKKPSPKPPHPNKAGGYQDQAACRLMGNNMCNNPEAIDGKEEENLW